MSPMILLPVHILAGLIGLGSGACAVDAVVSKSLPGAHRTGRR
jgi:hypothetical protein